MIYLNLIRQYDATYRIFFQLQISELPSENTLPNWEPEMKAK